MYVICHVGVENRYTFVLEIGNYINYTIKRHRGIHHYYFYHTLFKISVGANTNT